ncbi:karyopherin beta [Reticulomyxa filosa]|uniref:Karyopherin beta n=1 Tax=Reticulomyxa filosa TaxID=46433 RepID=X6LNJ2_RETFI|nr:karyopherin beta [Reticulomyxa filosa]|eukprot:ETO03493.1 karyopherin beta [Reticulomyxa filosa]
MCVYEYKYVEPNKKYFGVIPREEWESFEKVLMTLLTQESEHTVYTAISQAVGVFASRVVYEDNNGDTNEQQSRVHTGDEEDSDGKDAHQLMKLLLPMRKSLQEAKDNTAYNSLNQLFARICQAIEEEFVQYFPQVIPHLLKSASIDAGHILRPDEQSPADANFHVLTIHLRGVGDAAVSLNPISLEEKTTACQILYQLAHDQPLVVSATHILFILLKSIVIGMQDAKSKKSNSNNDITSSSSYSLTDEHVQQMQKIVQFIWDPFKDAIISERDLCSYCHYCKSWPKYIYLYMYMYIFCFCFLLLLLFIYSIYFDFAWFGLTCCSVRDAGSDTLQRKNVAFGEKTIG